MVEDISSLLPSFLRKEEISRYESHKVYILDRRALPFKKEYVVCSSPKEVAGAIKAMVTQGGGPLECALNTLYMVSRDGYDLKETVEVLSSSRPTNRTMSDTLHEIMDRVGKGEAIEELVPEYFRRYDERYDRMSDYGESLISDGDGILTTCFPEHSFILSCRKALLNGKKIHVYVPETRPYFQGAHLTAPALYEVGVPVTLITDGMGASMMADGRIDKYMTASDSYLADGSVVNKAGTLANAISAKYYGIPYYPFAIKKSEKLFSEMEWRNGDDVKEAQGKATTLKEIDALYPAFDHIPSSLVTAVVTEKGIEENR